MTVIVGVFGKESWDNMFSVGELVVYGGEGVCRVTAVGESSIPGTDKEKLYYTLTPVYHTGHVLTPVDTKVLIRPVMTRQEAELLVEELPALEPEGSIGGPRATKEHYQEIVSSYDCREVARLILTTTVKRSRAIRRGKKPSQMDERYLKRAEEEFYGELAAALEVDRDDAEVYVHAHCPQWPVSM